jgi:hypothetical protein
MDFNSITASIALINEINIIWEGLLARPERSEMKFSSSSSSKL